MIARAPSLVRPLVPSAKLGLVSIPEAAAPDAAAAFDARQARELLHDLARDLGLSVLAPRPEEFPEEGASDAAPLFGDEAVRKTLEAADVVWMDGEEAVAVFALETSVLPGEGVRRLADLLALHPKLKAALYAVSMPSQRGALLAEINRPAYRLLKKPLPEAVRLLDWPRLHGDVAQLGERVRYLKPEFLEGISDVAVP